MLSSFVPNWLKQTEKAPHFLLACRFQDARNTIFIWRDAQGKRFDPDPNDTWNEQRTSRTLTANPNFHGTVVFDVTVFCQSRD